MTRIVKLNSIELYPDGKGGQLGDRGYVNGIKIIKVLPDNVVELESEIDETSIKVDIDIKRRKEIARNHTGQHILSQAILKVCDVKTVSFHMGESYSTIDLQRNLSDKEIVDSEDLANEIVARSLEVKKYFVKKDELPSLGLRKISDVKDNDIRIVDIEGFDKSMCAGFHVDRTSEVMLIKILKLERVKGGLYRLYFVCGEMALNDYRNKNNVYNECVSVLSSNDPIETLKSKLDELKTIKKKMNNLTKEHMVLKAKEVFESFEMAGNVKAGVVETQYNQGEMRLLVQNLLKLGDILVVVYGEKDFVIGSNVINLKNLNLNLKGGGNKEIFMGKLDEKGNNEWALKILENLKSYI